MKKLGIIRPCKIGDLIISLPIGKYYHDKGYEVLWPIMSNYYEMFNEVAGHYIKFIPILDSFRFAISIAKENLKHNKADEILNLSFNVGNFSDENSIKYKKSNLRFDEFVYKLAEVPFEYKWNLEIKRNIAAENEFFKKKIKESKYSVGHFDVEYNKYGWAKGISTRQGYYNLCKKYAPNNLIEILPDKEFPSLFYWIKILQKAEKLFLIDSSAANLVEGLNLDNQKYFLLRSIEKDSPILKNKWHLL